MGAALPSGRASADASRRNAVATFVLVPGAWAGGWVWRKVGPRLRAAGHEVHTPTLTGLGERVHLAHPGIDLETHVADVANVLAFEDLTGITLVGWSHGGMVIAGVAERVPERLAQLVFLDAVVPADGQSFYDADRDLAARHAAERAGLGTTADPAYLPAPVDYLRARVPNEADLAWLAAKMVPHPVATLTQPLRLGNPAAAALPRAFVFCTEGKEPGFQSVATVARLRADPGWRYREIASTHLAPVTAPEETAAALLSLV
jgi:pimeloyl-ACP methyl ester carboxylesterase